MSVVSADRAALHRIRSRRHVAAAAGPVCMEDFVARLVDALIRMRAEIISLGLQEIGRQLLAAIPVKEGERGRKRGKRDAELHRLHNDLPPGLLAFVDNRLEIVVEQ